MSASKKMVSDRELMARAKAGELNCFEEIIFRYQAALWRVAHSRLGRPEMADDAVQETFLCAFKSRQTYDDRYSLRTWLWTILLNQCRRHMKRQNRSDRVRFWSDASSHEERLDRKEPSIECRAPGPVASLLAKERVAVLESLMAQLSHAQADALRLRFFGGLKYQEIAETMGCSLATAKNRVRFGLLRLSQKLRSDDARTESFSVIRGTADATTPAAGESGERS